LPSTSLKEIERLLPELHRPVPRLKPENERRFRGAKRKATYIRHISLIATIGNPRYQAHQLVVFSKKHLIFVDF